MVPRNVDYIDKERFYIIGNINAGIRIFGLYS